MAEGTLFQETIRKTLRWIEEVMASLGETDPHKGFNALRAVLQALRDRRQAQRLHHLAVGPAEVAHQDRAALLRQDLLDRLERGADARVVGDVPQLAGHLQHGQAACPIAGLHARCGGPVPARIDGPATGE